jgi:hypothetical protein
VRDHVAGRSLASLEELHGVFLAWVPTRAEDDARALAAVPCTHSAVNSPPQKRPVPGTNLKIIYTVKGQPDQP